ncbi:putative ubiquitin-like protein FUBI-like protein ENSP00000310146 [Pan troglodytes]|uniref:putative ubiquitin-like protein FUBI-like protein ENSP00000310146 n=1 Tax=Pan troglodytes TaxID=9598 RepID=UPI0007DB91A5|nr:putative ubiquitin-like protein FUBI-like protein ENSP00000310146 [Pan troglodytes]
MRGRRRAWRGAWLGGGAADLSLLCPQVAYMRARELHTLEVTGLETVAQSKAHVASLEGLISEDKVVLLAGSPLQNEATLGQCGVEALTTLEVVGRRLGGNNCLSLQVNPVQPARYLWTTLHSSKQGEPNSSANHRCS